MNKNNLFLQNILHSYSPWIPEKYKYKIVTLMGAAVSGKSTFRNILLKSPTKKYVGFSSGEYFSYIMNKADDEKTDLELKVSYLMKNVRYVSDDIAIRLFREKIQNMIENGEYDPSSQILIADGIPRTVPQIAMVEKFAKINKAIYFTPVNDNDFYKDGVFQKNAMIDKTLEIAHKRIEELKKIEKQKELKGLSKTMAEGRKNRYDDEPELVTKRILQFFELSYAMKNIYQKKGILYTFETIGALGALEMKAEVIRDGNFLF